MSKSEYCEKIKQYFVYLTMNLKRSVTCNAGQLYYKIIAYLVAKHKLVSFITTKKVVI